MSKARVERQVRQRAQFKCEYCNKFIISQYAHIIPDRDDGPRSLDNLLYLCYEHHVQFDAKAYPKDSIRYSNLINKMYEIKALSKVTSPISKSILDGNDSNNIRTVVIGTNRFELSDIIFRHSQNSDIELLNISLTKNQLVIKKALFMDQSKLIATIIDNQFYSHSEMLWDIIFTENRTIEFISKDKSLRFKLNINENSELELTGKLYYFGYLFEFSPTQGIVGGKRPSNQQSIVNNNSWFGSSAIFNVSEDAILPAEF